MKALTLALALGSATALSGCYATGYTTTSGDGYVYEDPPPPREEVVVTRPGFVWIHGSWQRDHDRWAWRSGRYERERPGHRYIEGRWEHRGKRRVYVDGGWQASGGVTVR